MLFYYFSLPKNDYDWFLYYYEYFHVKSQKINRNTFQQDGVMSNVRISLIAPGIRCFSEVIRDICETLSLMSFFTRFTQRIITFSIRKHTVYKYVLLVCDLLGLSLRADWGRTLSSDRKAWWSQLPTPMVPRGWWWLTTPRLLWSIHHRRQLSLLSVRITPRKAIFIDSEEVGGVLWRSYPFNVTCYEFHKTGKFRRKFYLLR